MKNLVSVFSLVYYACKILLVVLLFQWWMGDAFAMETRLDVHSTHSANQNSLGDNTFEFKSSVICAGPFTGKDPYFKGRPNAEYLKCPDGTVSMPQPESTGNAGWNGYCGQTAVSNVTAMLCERFIRPTIIDDYATDMTPGNLPSTNLKALKILFNENFRSVRAPNPCPGYGDWKLFGADNGYRFLIGIRTLLDNGTATIERRRRDGTKIRLTPVPVLIEAGFTALHWVTVVDLIENPDDYYKCDAVMNTWGSQKIMTCENLARYGQTSLMGYRYLGFVP